MLDTPVALILFNRPDATAEVFAAIAEAKPRKLFLIADGPRPSVPEDVARCAAARAVVEKIDWDCEVHRDFAEKNLGCGRRPASGISWVFSQVEEAIILEDNCVPDPTFFRFCEEMLERYRDDTRIMTISAHNPHGNLGAEGASYSFLKLPNCWGWATWRRAWEHFDFKMASWPALEGTPWLSEFLEEERFVDHFSKLFQNEARRLSTLPDEECCVWDFQWLFSCWKERSLCVMPDRSLVRNIGVGEDSTHTKDPDKFLTPDKETVSMEFPLRHPARGSWNRELELARMNRLVENVRAKRPGFFTRLRKRLVRRMKSNLLGFVAKRGLSKA